MFNLDTIIDTIFLIEKQNDKTAIAKKHINHFENGEIDLIDIIEFDAVNKISKLKIIHDTVVARKLVVQLKE